LAGIDAAAGLGLGNLTAQPLHLVKLRERNFESAESRRRKKKVSYKKDLSLFSAQPQHAHGFNAQPNGWRVNDH